MDVIQESFNTDELIDGLGGCGRFQIAVTFFVFWVKVVGSMSMIMMAFGNYNPGWKCLVTINSTSRNPPEVNYSRATHFGNLANATDKCDLHSICSKVQYTSGISTVVSEWNLICDRSWISSLIISVQMMGVLFGAYLSGYLGDKIGRKRTMYVATLYHIAVNVIAIFSSSWQMFAVMRFFIGLAIPIMMYAPVVFALEYVQYKWRNAIVCLPIWTIGCMFFALSAIATESWRYIHGINAAASLIALLPAFWVPESLRWLAVKRKKLEACAVVSKMAALNRKEDKSVEYLQGLENRYRKELRPSDFSCLDLLRPGVRYATVVSGFCVVSMSIIYYAISFSIKSLPGSFYSNMFILFASEVPLTVVSSILPNYIGRKLSIIIFLSIATLSLFGIVGLDLLAGGNLEIIGPLVCAILARTFVESAWDIVNTYVGELFPTVIRSTSMAYTSWISRIGGIISPYLIPDNPDTYFINYLIMASCALVCCGLILFLKDTKGKSLQDTWEEEDEVCVTSPMSNSKLVNSGNTEINYDNVPL